MLFIIALRFYNLIMKFDKSPMFNAARAISWKLVTGGGRGDKLIH